MARSKLSKASITELQGEIRRRERRLASLERKRERLAAQLSEVEGEIRDLGGQLGAEGGGKRPRNTRNLADALADLLSDQTLSVTEAAAEVQRAGYRTTSPNFRTIVNQTLLKDNRFRRVGRGQYTTRGSGGASKKRVAKKGAAARGKKRSTRRRGG
jgi:chromosome segregation ATPase